MGEQGAEALVLRNPVANVMLTTGSRLVMIAKCRKVT
jgi:hypothetical protein